jgi:phage recombination protein Bet
MTKEKELSVAKAQELIDVKITKEDIKNIFCPLATEKELVIALGIVKSLKLNPFTREVHFIKYRNEDKINIVVGYEVYLKRAERTGKLDGWEAGVTEDGQSAWVRIHRKDWNTPFYWEVKLSEFNKKQATWNQIPSFMGKKVAIGQAFRLAFPDELGGMPYTKEETEVYDVAGETVNMKPKVAMPQEKTDKTQPEKMSSEPQQKAIHTLSGKIWGKDEQPLFEMLINQYKVESTKELTMKQASEVIEKLSAQSNGKK